MTHSCHRIIHLLNVKIKFPRVSVISFVVSRPLLFLVPWETQCYLFHSHYISSNYFGLFILSIFIFKIIKEFRKSSSLISSFYPYYQYATTARLYNLKRLFIDFNFAWFSQYFGYFAHFIRRKFTIKGRNTYLIWILKM